MDRRWIPIGAAALALVGWAASTVRVYGPPYLLFTSISTRTASARPRRTTTVTWKVPADLSAARLQFCVLAEDPTGNQSRTSCAPLTVS